MPDLSALANQSLRCLSTWSSSSREVFGTLFGAVLSLNMKKSLVTLWSERTPLCTAMQRQRHKLSLKVSSKISFDTRPRARLRSQSCSEPVPKRGCLASTTFTAMLENSTNTHLVLDRSMLSRFNCWFSWTFNQLPASAKGLIQGEPLCCL